MAGDAALLRRFLLYRTYHGSAMSLAVQHASVAAWRDEKARAVLIQVGVLCAVILVIAWLARNAIESISTQQIATGFEFLEHTAGFGIAQRRQ